VSHIRKSYQDSIVSNVSEKLLANRPTRSKRIEIINTNQSVPKKSKIVQTKTGGGPLEAGGSSSEMKIRKTPLRGASINRKSAPSGRKKSATAGKGKVSMPSETRQTVAPLDEQIRIRAYFISERRRRFALPGDADSDWLEAKRQLLSESGPR
jgi:hypothetical protein